MGKICKNHDTCCKEWGIPVLIIGVIFLFSMIFPGKFWVLVALMGSPLGMLIVGACVTTATGLIFRRKMQVSAWENDRPFNDGDDDTPDPYLFNPGPGATWGLRAFMPDVESYSFAKTPISWLFKQSKRKVAILLDDGTVSFPWFPVAWISEAAGGGTRIDVPEGWKITALQAKALQTKRDEIKSILPRHRSERQNDFMLFTDLIFGKKSKIGREPVAVGSPGFAGSSSAIDRLASVVEKMAGEVATKVDVGTIVDMKQILRELAEWREKRPTTLGRHQKVLLDLNNRISKLEMNNRTSKSEMAGAGPASTNRKPSKPQKKK